METISFKKWVCEAQMEATSVKKGVWGPDDELERHQLRMPKKTGAGPLRVACGTASWEPNGNHKGCKKPKGYQKGPEPRRPNGSPEVPKLEPKGPQKPENREGDKQRSPKSRKAEKSADPLVGRARPLLWGEVSSPLPPSALGALPGHFQTSTRLSQTVQASTRLD